MTGENAIIAKNISKKYFRNQDVKSRLFKKCKEEDAFYALKNINLEIKKGEVIGIIGPNGAGKSTFLKIIAEVTPPSEGTIEIIGHVASILEIGIGFQPELSGYENIFLSGRLYGLTKKQIQSLLDNIINMFGFPEFIHTKVKHYSTGMYMRLAFSVIINIEADIYLFDEVLNVGDAAFQGKALEEIIKLKEKGKTILIVSHVPKTIHNICDKMLLLEKSRQISFSTPNDTMTTYLQLIQKQDKAISTNFTLDKNNLKLLQNNYTFNIEIEYFQIRNSGYNNQNRIFYDKPIEIISRINYQIENKHFYTILIRDENGNLLNTQKIILNNLGKSTKEEIIITFEPNTFCYSQYSLETVFLNENYSIVCFYRNMLSIELYKSNGIPSNLDGIVNIKTSIIRKII